ncbi:hypothetical protein OEZ85_012424 [Tetradesmus obliquus]|uniref:Uncharacterized protein n=1 Tax=Tetradesmus obliquus TaxID=3088 RepID=A0ABY8TVN1_TETOB|nr:hypothetical protein OEZ85_012424 [Tetradesmus obliquus]
MGCSQALGALLQLVCQHNSNVKLLELATEELVKRWLAAAAACILMAVYADPCSSWAVAQQRHTVWDHQALCNDS